jgi:hypothetical protein
MFVMLSVVKVLDRSLTFSAFEGNLFGVFEAEKLFRWI